MQATNGNKSLVAGPNARLIALGVTLPTPPSPLGAYVESSDAGDLLFLSGTLPVVNGKLAMTGRLEKFKTSNVFDGTAHNPQWMG